MTACTRIGCGGSIASDNYCDTCGFPAEKNPAPAAASSPAPSTSLPTPTPPSAPSAVQPSALQVAAATPPAAVVNVGTICEQPDCDGGIVQADGYCNTCGASGANVVRSVEAVDGVSTATPSIALPTAPSTSSRTTGQIRRRASNESATQTLLGRGLVQVQPTAVGDPSTAVMSEEKIQNALGTVPEDRRNCAKCGTEVGRAEDGVPGRVTGFCGQCRTPFDFVTNTPSLQPGELVAGQYRILGPLAHGGMGWIYLGQDTAVSNRWVVLKGLLNEDDADAVASAVAERQFLAQIEHGRIVNIYNFVTHGGAGYIVMEYVGGESLNRKLKDRRQANNGVPDPLPVPAAISYILGILPALGYLHSLGLVYNDLKPANIMATAGDVKLIDVGGVMRWDDRDAAIFGTRGFQAPEVAVNGPSVASDLYTVGRTLAVLVLNFVFHSGTYEFALPDQGQEPLFARWEQFYRFLLKSTASHPDDRFQTAEEMEEQLLSVLRQIVSLTDGQPRPVPSSIFTGDRLTDLIIDSQESGSTVRPEWRALPMPRIKQSDPASKFLLELPDDNPQRSLELIQAGIEAGQIPSSSEVGLRFCQLTAETGGQAETTLAQIETIDPWDWRVDWIRGIIALRDQQPAVAADRFSKVWTDLPGEIAPKLAVAVAAEMAGEVDRAAALYASVVTTDPTFVSASFGLARCRTAAGDRDGAIEAYGYVPSSSATYMDAQISKARTLVFEQAKGSGATAEDVVTASTAIDRLQLAARERALLTAEILQKTLSDLASGRLPPNEKATVFGGQLTEDEVRTSLEDTYRELARLAPNTEERATWVDRANGIRSFSLF